VDAGGAVMHHCDPAGGQCDAYARQLDTDPAGDCSGTTVAARLIDVSTIPIRVRPGQPEFPGENFLLDILSDKNGVSIHRLQSVLTISSSGLVHRAVLRI